MAAIKWTPEQEAAITYRDTSLLVSAAAGAGKTAVLVERVIHSLLHEQEEIDELLVVTFTEAAATEMRQRIGKALEERLSADPTDRRVARQLSLLPRAHISTLHAFCLWALRRYFYRLDLDPGFRVLDQGEERLVKLEVLEDVMEDHYREEEPASDFYQLVDNYSDRSGELINRLILDLYEYAQSQIFPDKWLAECAAAFKITQGSAVEELLWWEEVRSFTEAQVKNALTLLEAAYDLAKRSDGPDHYRAPLEDDMATVHDLQRALEHGWDQVVDVCTGLSFARASKRPKNEVDQQVVQQVQNLRKEAKDILTGLDTSVFTRKSGQVVADLQSLSVIVGTLVSLVQEFGVAYAQAKAGRGMLSFSDLERFTLRLLLDETAEDLRPSETALELRDLFSEVLCDEYQDINPVQDGILSLLAGEDIFMVGDVKQSIYRFRLAEPDIFLRRLKETNGEGTGRSVHLSANFRCRSSVVNAVNQIFGAIMSEDVGGIKYSGEERLRYAAGYPEYDGDQEEPPVNVVLLEGDPQAISAAQSVTTATEDEELDPAAAEREAAYIARSIRELIQRPEPFLVWDKDAKHYRPVRYRDIVVLLRSTNVKANQFVDVFNREGVPLYTETGSGYFKAVEIEIILALLAIIDNPRQDIPLAGVLRSPLFGFSTRELADIRRTAPKEDFFSAVVSRAGNLDELGERLQHFLSQLDEWRTRARRNPLSRLVWHIYAETGFYDYVGGMPGGGGRQANLRAFYNRARQFDQFARQGLVRFLQFITDLQASGEDLGTAPALGEGEDVVRLMSIHKSKGLEFPVVFVAGLGTRFNEQDLQGALLFDRRLGLGAQLVAAERHTKAHTLSSIACRQAIRRQTLSEEMRILYVALTRAREKLTLVGTVRDMDGTIHKWRSTGETTMEAGVLDPGQAASARSYLDWILPVLCGVSKLVPDFAAADSDYCYSEAEGWSLELLPALAVAQALAYEDKADEPESSEVDAKNDDGWDAETSTALQAQLAWDYPHAEDTTLPAKISVTELKRRQAPVEEDLETPAAHLQMRPFKQPTFMQKKARDLSPAQAGSATHLVLEHLPLSGAITSEAVDACVHALVQRQCLTEAEGSAVDQGSICRFFQSSLGERMLRAFAVNEDKVWREIPFMAAFQGSHLGLAASDEDVMLQGVIDCMFAEPDGWVLVDFKTDRIFGNAAKQEQTVLERYESQVRWYAEAAQRILDLNVKECYIHLLHAGQSIPLSAPRRLQPPGEHPKRPEVERPPGA